MLPDVIATSFIVNRLYYRYVKAPKESFSRLPSPGQLLFVFCFNLPVLGNQLITSLLFGIDFF
jgi:hypothetical protein